MYTKLSRHAILEHNSGYNCVENCLRQVSPYASSSFRHNSCIRSCVPSIAHAYMAPSVEIVYFLSDDLTDFFLFFIVRVLEF